MLLIGMLSQTQPNDMILIVRREVRTIAAELGVSIAFLAHQYALSMPGVDTVVLGVKNREELAECLAAEAAGPLEDALIARIDEAVVV